MIYIKFFKDFPFDNEKFLYKADKVYKCEYNHGKLFVIKGQAEEVSRCEDFVEDIYVKPEKRKDDSRKDVVKKKTTRKKRTKK